MWDIRSAAFHTLVLEPNINFIEQSPSRIQSSTWADSAAYWAVPGTYNRYYYDWREMDDTSNTENILKVNGHEFILLANAKIDKTLWVNGQMRIFLGSLGCLSSDCKVIESSRQKELLNYIFWMEA